MKIVHLTGYFQPEFGYKEYYIARNQVKAGHDVHVITSNKTFPFPNYKVLAERLTLPVSRTRDIGESQIDGIKVHRLPTIIELKDSIIVRGIGELLKRLKPDIVHAYPIVHLMTAAASFYKSELGYFLIFDDQQFESYHTFLGALRYNIVLKPLARKAFKKADVVFCPSQAAIDFISRNYLIDRKKIELVPLGVDKDFYYFSKYERDKMRGKLGILSSDTLLITTARISREKKFELLIEAINKLKSSNIKLLLVGDGDSDYLAELKGLAKKFGLSSKILFHHFVPEKELYKFYSAADVGVWPKRPTISIINAIGCELPVLIPDHPTMDHLVEEGNGILFDPRNEDDLLNKIKSMTGSKRNLKSMREKARKLISDKLSYQKLALRDLEAYKHFKQQKN